MVRLIAICLIVVLTALAWVLLGDDRTATSTPNSVNVSEPANPEIGQGEITENTPGEQRNGQTAGEPAGWNPDSEDQQPVDVPPLLNGRLGSSALLSGDYAHYDRRVLEKLVIGGDATAMQVLAVKLAVEGGKGNLEDAANLMEGAIIHGARRHPFEYLAGQACAALRRAAKGDIELSGEQKREAMVETFVYGELAALRGYPQLKPAIQWMLSNRFGLEPTPEEREAIVARAKTVYDNLQSRRNQLGLGPFD